MPRTEKNKGMVGEGLFAKELVGARSIIMEYTGNRVCGRDLRRMNGSFDYHGIHLDVQVSVPAERAVIDPRVAGNIEYSIDFTVLKLSSQNR